MRRWSMSEATSRRLHFAGEALGVVLMAVVVYLSLLVFT